MDFKKMSFGQLMMIFGGGFVAVIIIAVVILMPSKKNVPKKVVQPQPAIGALENDAIMEEIRKERERTKQAVEMLEKQIAAASNNAGVQQLNQLVASQQVAIDDLEKRIVTMEKPKPTGVRVVKQQRTDSNSQHSSEMGAGKGSLGASAVVGNRAWLADGSSVAVGDSIPPAPVVIAIDPDRQNIITSSTKGR